MSKPVLIEKGKNLSLVVLFLSTILLLYFFWGNITFDGGSSSSAKAADTVTDPAALLKPEQIVVNFGSDNYTVLAPGNIWYNGSDGDSFVKELMQFGSGENIPVVEIKEEQYALVQKQESVWAEFRYNVPISDFCSILHIDKPQNYDMIDTVTTIGYSTAEGGNSLYIKDGKNQKYFRLVADNNKNGNAEITGFSQFIASIGAGSHDIYYPAGSVLGVENNTLIPLSTEADLKSFPYQKDAYSFQTEKVSALAKEFFGGNFDFVRQIKEENGTFIYMYGYGQNVLIVNTDGSIEYKEAQIGNNTGQSFSGALETAEKFIANHGSWESLDGAELTPYLKDVIRNPNKKEGYRFVFGTEINGTRIYYEDGDPLIIDVTSGQVTYYKRDFIDFDQKDLETIETSGSPEQAFSSVNLIAENYKYIYNVLLSSGSVKAAADENAVFNTIAAMVNNMQIGYVKQADDGSMEIQPAWIVSITGADVNFYFNLYTAEPIGYTKE